MQFVFTQVDVSATTFVGQSEDNLELVLFHHECPWDRTQALSLTS